MRRSAAIDTLRNPADEMKHSPLVRTLLEELRIGLTRYLEIAEGILKQSGIRIWAPKETFFSFEKNFFSLLFLYTYHRAGIPKSRRILYASTLQCLRGMVTGCDNILDDEYKKTLDTDLPIDAIRFRSVIDIMVSDRVLFELLMDSCRRGEIDVEQAAAASAASMKTMTQSGIQEASEEAGIEEILPPEAILKTVHHYKTGILFNCPWDIPRCLEDLPESETTPLMEGLYRVGMGCQVLDDMVDFMSDLERKRHNYVVSLIHHGPAPVEKERLGRLLAKEGRASSPVLLPEEFPENLETAFSVAHEFLESGLNLLYPESQRFLVAPSISFLENRIGAAHLHRKQV